MKTRSFICPVLVAALLVLTGGAAIAGAPPPPPLDLLQRVAVLEAAVTALQSANAAQQAVIYDLQNTVTALQSQMATISASPVMALNPYLTVTTGATPQARFSGLNIQLVNGTGATASRNGLGNLIIGYDPPRPSTLGYFCSDGQYTDEYSCVGAGETWAASHKTGSHYLVIGDENNYSQYGGLVVGSLNVSNAPGASVSGGWMNIASGEYASVSGGFTNTASGRGNSVSGGAWNTASGAGGASVSGGLLNEASGVYASVSGGGANRASGEVASVSGGNVNEASGKHASVSGGNDRDAPSEFDWRAGGLFQDE